MSATDLEGHFHGRNLWAVILGGSSGFGLATARRLASSGLNLVLAHKDPMGIVEEVLEPAFDEIRAEGIELVTYNGDLGDEEERGYQHHHLSVGHIGGDGASDCLVFRSGRHRSALAAPFVFHADFAGRFVQR